MFKNLMLTESVSQNKKITYLAHLERRNMGEMLAAFQRLHHDLPEVVIRITPNATGKVGTIKGQPARGFCVIFVEPKLLTSNYIYQIVAREIIRAYKGFEYRKTCPLMSKTLIRALPRKEVDLLFKRYMTAKFKTKKEVVIE